MSRVYQKLAALLCAFLLAAPITARAAGSAAEPETSPLAAGFLHSAVVKEDGTLWAAGSNSHGQLGNGAAGPEGEASAAGESESSSAFIQIMENVRSVYAGNLNTFAIDNNGTLYGWGMNEGGQLGLGDTENRISPTEILTDIVTMAPGQFHTAAVSKNGTLWTWGWNDSGQLGSGAGTDATITAPKEALEGVRSVAVGMKHTMAVKSDNTLWAAGDNQYGQLADGGTDSADTFRQVMENVHSVACSPFGTLILKTDGTLWACGYNDNGDLGNGTYEDIPEPVQIMENVLSMACSKDYSDSEGFSAAISKEGVLYAWGSDSYSQYGPEPSTTPVEVAQGVTDMALGGGHLLYLTEEGTVQALGNNEKGQLGNETTQNTTEAETVAEGVSPTPRPISPVFLVLTVAGIVLAVTGLFVFLIVRTLRGKKSPPKKEKPQKPSKNQKGSQLSDRELIRLAREMERAQKEKGKEKSAKEEPQGDSEKASEEDSEGVSEKASDEASEEKPEDRPEE